AGYMGRLVWIVFFGKPKSDAASHAHESGFTMLLPLIVLAVLSVTGGWLQFWPEQLGHIIHLDEVKLHNAAGYTDKHHLVLILGSAAWIVGLLGSLLFYGKGATEDQLEKRAAPVYGFLKDRLWFDEIYGYYVAKIQQRFAGLLSVLDVFVIKGVLVRGSAGLVGLIGMCSKSQHVGSIHGYVYWFLAGLIFFWVVATGVLKAF
ncbi:MAG: NADH-quinone oxidoreductase subunit L, partial [Opitutales bacterium]|nr:NADH-quinone oxidoreductase subunit L [Opitutales bacterium]